MMRTVILIGCLSFLFACKAAADLRPAIKGVICDADTRTPLADVNIVSYDKMNQLAVTNVSGNFEIAAVKEKRALPTEEHGKLAPHSDMLLAQKNGYNTDTLSIFGAKARHEANTIVMDTVFLKKEK